MIHGDILRLTEKQCAKERYPHSTANNRMLNIARLCQQHPSLYFTIWFVLSCLLSVHWPTSKDAKAWHARSRTILRFYSVNSELLGCFGICVAIFRHFWKWSGFWPTLYIGL